MSMSTNTGGLRQNLPKTFQDNAPSGGRPQTLPAMTPQQSYDQYSKTMLGGGAEMRPAVLDPNLDLSEQTTGRGRIDDSTGLVDPGFNVSPVSPGGKGGQFGPGMTPGGGGKSMLPIFRQPGEAPPDQGFIKSPSPALPPQMQQPMPGPGYVGGIRTPPSNYRPPNQGGGILRSRRTGMPINR